MPLLTDGSGSGFVSGWTPHHAKMSAASRQSRGVRMYQLSAAATAPSRKAYSLSRHRIRKLMQGQAGTCWLHGAVRLAELNAKAQGRKAFPINRRLVGWAGKRLDGGGNPSNGGSVTSALEAMTLHQGRGYGCAREELWPYSDDYRALAQNPPAAVIEDGKLAHLDALVDVRSDAESVRLIDADHAVGNGIWWPYGWDTMGGTFFQTIGPGTYGHALTEMGYVLPGVWDDHLWFQLDNWHGEIYKPLPKEYADKVEGYQPTSPDKTTDFWVRADVYATVRGYGYAERATATDLEGFGYLLDLADAAILAGYTS